MPRVEIAAQGWGDVQDTSGNAQPSRTVTLSGTVYGTQTGSTVVSPVVTNTDGTIPGWIEQGTYTLTVGGVSHTVEAVTAGLFYNVKSYGAIGDGAANDTAAINAAIAAMPAAGGTLYFPAATYRFAAASLTVRSNVVWLGDGRGLSILKMLDGANGRGLSSTASLTNITFRELTWDFNMAAQTDGVSRDDRSGHFLTNVNILRYINCEITGGRSGAALRFDTCNRTLLLGNYFHDNGFHTTLNGAQTLPLATITVASTAGFAASGTLTVGDNQTVTYTGVTGTTFTGCAGGVGLMPAGAGVIPNVGGVAMQSDHNFNSNADFLRVIGNTYERGTDTGTAQDGMQHTAVIGNIYDTNILAVSISNSTSRSSAFNAIGDNSIKGGGARFRTSVGIKISTFGSPAPGNMTDGVVTNNTVHDADRALWIEECDRMVVTGNNLGTPNANSANKQVVLVASTGTMNNNRIAGNTIHDTTNRGISFSGGTVNNLDIENNNFVACTTVIGGTIPTSCRIRNNHGYNPQGVVAVTVGASPFTYTAGTTPEVVSVSGGTVSVVAKNGITLYTGTNVSVPLEPAEPVTVTYSVLPTMNADRK